ncbi:Ca-activated chloride channel family protein [Silvimonas terrae]|uniref:Ca-activated chloride channel family protein n=1 Tax=Silvimonas terrae TaxID=300266 RepID=A0A840RJA7_9NEIS|nr:VWA domain-containing protein [Silvimonas terrae]MBB5193395.1 Ca-activated chloride channel family protein [Silvimonas terrae]
MSSQDTAKYKHYDDNGIQQVAKHPLTTFSLDMDTGSYANVRRFLNQGSLPPADAVRTEELINYFPAEGISGKRLNNSPFAANYELAPSPWDPNKVLLRVNVEAVGNNEPVPASNLVFLVDVSGSMDSPERLPLIKTSLKMLTRQLRPQDTVSLVTYASGTRVVLPPLSGENKAAIEAAIDQLQAGGGTAGASGLALAYQMARQGFIAGGVNRVLLATDGDFNVGVTSTQALIEMVKRERDSNVTLSTLGVGGSNFNDAMMVQIADAGNGNYSYLDSLSEANKVLHDEMQSTLVTVAKDVKAQIEFNPAQVIEYRQIGYEKRQLRNEDFNNDKVDAGDIGAGKRVTVLYELTLKGGKPSVDPSRYQSAKAAKAGVTQHGDELAYLKLRWKKPEGKQSQLVSMALQKSGMRISFNDASTDTRFLAAVAAYGQKLRNNPSLASTSWTSIADWAAAAKGQDTAGYRAEFVRLAGLAGLISPTNPQTR